jgi:two-component system, NtrC family, sensor kinase
MAERKALRYIITFSCLALSLTALASKATSEHEKGVIPFQHLEVFTGDNRIDAFDFNAQNFQPATGITNLGVTREWKFLRLNLKQELQGKHILLDNPALDSIRFYHISSGGSRLLCEGGDGYAFSDLRKSHTAVYCAVPADSAAGHVLIGIKSAEQIVAPIFYGERAEIESLLNKREIFYAIYMGLMIALLLYNFFIFLSVRDRTYIYYVFYIFTVGFTQMILNGYANKYVWPNSASLGIYASAVVPILSGWAVILFARHFIQTKVFAPWIDRALIGFAGLYVISLAAVLFNRFDISFNIINANASAALILIPAAIKGMRSGYRPAGYFLIAFAFFLVGVTLFALRNFGVAPFNNFTTYALPIGSAIEAILLSFALADRINQFKKEKEESQQQAIVVMQENERLIREQNVNLEQMVHERTLDLERANNDLNLTLNDLRLTQKQLVESEKLASLGQMTAGIAHEINNPINFVQSNVQPLRRDIDEVLGLLDEFARLDQNDSLTEKVSQLHRRYHELDMPYLRKEVGQLLQGIEEGSRRTAEIVRSLRIFSRMDRDTIVAANVNDCLTSTLMVMKNVTKGQVTLQRDLEDNLPMIHCFPGKLNQVFMNIISNAVQATEMPGRSDKDRLVSIRSESTPQEIIVTITDNGKGIPEEIRSKIFDPFFTTKNVGQGTGLGLSIALGIINEHKGRIEVHSTPGEGTRVVVSLPRDTDHV